MEKYKFSLNHFVLLSKGWYQNSDNNDELTLYKRVLALDGHSYITSIQDVLTVVMGEFNNWNEWKKEHKLSNFSLFDFYLQVRDYHFYRKDVPLDEVMVDFIRSQFASIPSDYAEIKPPVFSRKLYKQGLKMNTMFGDVPNGMTYKSQNKMVSKIFNKK